MNKTVHKISLALSVAFVCTFLLAPNLWFGDRFIPAAPIFDGGELPVFLNYTLVATLLVAVVFAPFTRSGITELSITGILLTLFAFDIHRFQLEMYLFATWFVLIGLYKRQVLKEMAILPSLMLPILAVYLVGGLMKLNPWFGYSVFKWVVSPLSEAPLGNYLQRAWLLGPVSELLLGMLLMFRKTRYIGLIAAVGYHALMLLLFGPLGNNYHRAMWPMQALLPVLIGLLVSESTYRNPFLYIKGCFAPKVILLFYFILPVFHVFGYWDAAPSLATYDGRHGFAYIAVEKYVVNKLPISISRHMKKVQDHEKYYFPVEELLEKETGVPFYHEQRVYIRYKKWLEPYANNPGDVFAVIFDKDGIDFIQ